MNEKQIRAVCDPTRLKILGLLSERPLTNTEIYNLLKSKGIVYRESIFKSLKKLKEAGLVKREYKEKKGYKYRLNFKQLKISRKVSIEVTGK